MGSSSARNITKGAKCATHLDHKMDSLSVLLETNLSASDQQRFEEASKRTEVKSIVERIAENKAPIFARGCMQSRAGTEIFRSKGHQIDSMDLQES